MSFKTKSGFQGKCIYCYEKKKKKGTSLYMGLGEIEKIALASGKTFFMYFLTTYSLFHAHNYFQYLHYLS